MLANSDTNPRIARLDTGAFTMFGGDPDLEGVTHLIRYSPIYIVTPENDKWKNIFLDKFKEKIQKLPFTDYCSDTVNDEKLTKIIDKLPEGYKIKKLDKDLCKKLSEDILNEYFLKILILSMIL